MKPYPFGDSPTCGRHIAEWYLDLCNFFGHFEFRLVSWLAEKTVVFRPPLSEARFKPIGSIRTGSSRRNLEKVGTITGNLIDQ